MALPVVNTKLAKKKIDPLDDLVDARMSVKPATSATAVNEVAKPMADAARQGRAGAAETTPRKVTTDPRQGKLKPADPMDDLVDARSATEAEIDASNAKQQMDARSRAGLGGLGLSGGAQAGAADLARQQARTKALTMADFDRMAEEQAFTDIKRDAAVYDFEELYDLDMDNDGKVAGVKVAGVIGDGDPDNNPDTTPSEKKPDAVRPEAGGKKKSIADMNDKEFNNLSKEQAEAAGWEAEAWLGDDKVTEVGAVFAKYARWIGPNGEVRIVPVDDVGELMSGGLEWED